MTKSSDNGHVEQLVEELPADTCVCRECCTTARQAVECLVKSCGLLYSTGYSEDLERQVDKSSL